MIFVGCSGFPVPASRYWGEFSGVELTETELGIPSDGTIRRWLRESPKNFAFSMMAPKKLVESAFAPTPENQALALAIGEVAKKMKAKAVVFTGPEDWKPTPTNRKTLKSFADLFPRDYPAKVVIDLPAWKPAQVLATVGDLPIAPAFDPLRDDEPDGDFLYARLPGPAGRRSRYDDVAIAELAKWCTEASAKETLCVFRNQDMFVNAKAIQKAVITAREKATKAQTKGAPKASASKATGSKAAAKPIAAKASATKPSTVKATSKTADKVSAKPAGRPAPKTAAKKK